MVSEIKKNTNKKQKKNSDSILTKWRLLFLGGCFTLGFLIIIGHLAIIQFIEGKELSEKAYAQQVENQIISPNRGTIYDSKGEILAQSIAVDTISLNPGKVKYANSKVVPDEEIAKGLSSIFNITYEKLMEELKKDKTVIVIERKVEKTKVDELKKWMAEKKITTGINIDEDSKRYYPNNNLASNLIGFCGTDNGGQTGLEERWDDVLTGTAGKIVTTTDVNKNAISDEYEQYVSSENGSNIYLTIDTKIQATAEKYLKQAMIENTTATAGNVLIMNPQNGEILAMASYPDYNLNEPSSYISTGYSEEEWKTLAQVDRSSALLNTWKNTAVSGTYEPGSTFKLITAAVGLEEGIVQTDTANDFNCTGSYVVAIENDEPVDISCWRALPHGSQTLRNALCNSCNPAFMQLGQRIGASTLYKYFKAFGLFEPVGGDIAKAYKGQFYKLEDMGPVELATTSFGQRFEISPLQLVTAISAICNDGVLIEPKIVKKIENTDTGSVDVIENETVRQVISKSTADKIKNMMFSVVTEGTGRNARVAGYSIGGKSGTSEPRVNHEEEGFVASFIAASPIENTQVVVLVALYGLQDYVYHQGGQVAGPVASQILNEVLPYLGIESTETAEVEEHTGLIQVPNVKDKTLQEARKILEGLGFSVICNSTLDPNSSLVVDQVPKYGISLGANSVICIYGSNEETRNKTQVPNVKDMTAAEAANSLRSKNLNIQVDGTSGIVVSQEPTYETEVEEGTVINVVIKEKLTDAQ